jgi:threonine/homoserine/homoserine lactone efflux protein
LSAILATSAAAFSVVKWLGAIYLVYLGVMALADTSSLVQLDAQTGSGRGNRTILWQAFVSDVLNPKVAVFFLALLPQFVGTRPSHPTLQILFLGVTVNVIALVGNIVLVALSASVTGALRRNRSVAGWLRRLLGATFVALGVRLAVEKPA